MSGKSGSKPKLVIIEGKDKGKIITLQDGTAVIGRSKGDVLIQDARVSRSHVAVHYDAKGGTLSFTDLKSLNGTTINGQPAESGELHDGDKLQLGDTLFDIQLSSEPVEEAEAEPRPAKKARKKKDSRSDAEARVESDSQAEPPLTPMNENSESPRRREPRAMSDALQPKTLLPKVWKAIDRVPQRARNYAMTAMILLGLYFYFGKGGAPGTGGGRSDLDREISAVQELARDGRLDEAVAKAEDARTHHAENSRIYLELGQLYTSQRKYEQAIAAYQKARTLKPEQPVVPVRLIRLYLRSGLNQEAESEMAVLDQMMKDGQHSRDLFVEAAQLFLEFKELNKSPEKALILSKALETDLAKDSPIGYKLEAQALFSQNRNEEALAALEKALALDPQDDWVLENLAFAKLSLKDISGASEVVENWIKVHPTATKALLVMAYLKYNDKNYAAALPYVQKIVQLSSGNPSQRDPLFPEALNLVGQIYLQQGNPQEAETYLKQACEQGFQQSCDNELVRKSLAAKPGEPGPASVPNQPQSPPAQAVQPQPPPAAQPLQPQSPQQPQSPPPPAQPPQQPAAPRR